MSGIRLVSKNEYFFPWATLLQAVDPTAPGNTTGIARQPTASKILDVFGMPFDGIVKALVMVINTVGAAGNSTDLKCAYRIRNGGLTLAGTTLVTEDALALDISATPDLIPVAGTRLIAGGLAGQANIPIGSQIHLHYNETGTIGTGTRPIVNPVGLILQAAGNIDPRDISSKH
jgi:hypothetical protein